ncbi:MAG: isoleucine--tRNA ligase, partial [Deltaproteobacteria bacterium]|nr:isoleucine--tRNA ligase [Deltaproteobacteria bacterium]
ARELTLALAPILTFTCDEVWEHLPQAPGAAESPLLEDFPRFHSSWNVPELVRDFDRLREVRAAVQKLLEEARTGKVIGHPLDAMVRLRAGRSHPAASVLEHYRDFLEEWLIVSAVEVEDAEGPDLEISVSHAPGGKCQRCWHWSPTVGRHAAHPSLCSRCAGIVDPEGR